MRIAKLLLTLITACSISCGPKPIAAPPEPPPDDKLAHNAMQLIGKFGFVSACPVNGLILTASHVIRPFEISRPALRDVMVRYTYSTPAGLRGQLSGVGTSEYRDVGTMTVVRGDTPSFYQLSTSAPALGDTVRWVQPKKVYGAYFNPVVKSAEVVSLVAGYIEVNHTATAGASGSCVWNEDGHVVGIVVWGIETGTGVLVSMTDPWWKWFLD